MRLRDVLRLDDHLDDVNDTWAEWTAPEPALARFGGLRDIQHWRRDAPWQEYRSVLLAIGRLTQSEGPSDRAMVAMMELVMPAMTRAVGRRASYFLREGRDVAEVAAGYVWTQIHDYPWHAPKAGWIVQALTRGVCRDLDRELGRSGPRGSTLATQRTDAQTLLDLLPTTPTPRNTPIQASTVYLWAVQQAGVSVADMELLVELAIMASDDRVAAHGRAGIGSMRLCREIAARTGATPRQLQYRAERALQRLRDHAGIDAA